MGNLIWRQRTSVSFSSVIFSILLSSCTSTPVQQQPDTRVSDDEARLSMYHETLQTLKSTPGPASPEDVLIVAASSSTPVNSGESISTVTSADLEQANARNEGYSSRADKESVRCFNEASAYLRQKDYYNAARSADECKVYAQQTGDPYAVQAASELRDEIRRTTGY